MPDLNSLFTYIDVENKSSNISIDGNGYQTSGKCYILMDPRSAFTDPCSPECRSFDQLDHRFLANAAHPSEDEDNCLIVSCSKAVLGEYAHQNGVHFADGAFLVASFDDPHELVESLQSYYEDEILWMSFGDEKTLQGNLEHIEKTDHNDGWLLCESSICAYKAESADLIDPDKLFKIWDQYKDEHYKNNLRDLSTFPFCSYSDRMMLDSSWKRNPQRLHDYITADPNPKPTTARDESLQITYFASMFGERLIFGKKPNLLQVIYMLYNPIDTTIYLFSNIYYFLYVAMSQATSRYKLILDYVTLNDDTSALYDIIVDFLKSNEENKICIDITNMYDYKTFPVTEDRLKRAGFQYAWGEPCYFPDLCDAGFISYRQTVISASEYRSKFVRDDTLSSAWTADYIMNEFDDMDGRDPVLIENTFSFNSCINPELNTRTSVQISPYVFRDLTESLGEIIVNIRLNSVPTADMQNIHAKGSLVVTTIPDYADEEQELDELINSHKAKDASWGIEMVFDPEFAYRVANLYTQYFKSFKAMNIEKLRKGSLLHGQNILKYYKIGHTTGEPISTWDAMKKAVKELDEWVYGQNAAKREAALIYRKNLEGYRTNALFIGPSGCGKTEIFRTLAKIHQGKKFYIYNAADITEEGWKGNKKYYSIFIEMLNSGWTKEEVESSIIVLDEFDKLLTPKDNSSGQNVSRSIQGEFLSMIEGGNISLERSKYDEMDMRIPAVINTCNISFVFLGAFTDIYDNRKAMQRPGIGFDSDSSNDIKEITIEDVIRFGMMPEVAGRISRIVTLDPIGQTEMENMLRSDANYNPIRRIEASYDIKMSIDAEYQKTLAAKSCNKDMGVRHLNSLLEDIVNDMYYRSEIVPKSVHVNGNGEWEPMPEMEKELKTATKYQTTEIFMEDDEII